jgi:hypothetical protein
MGLVDLSHNTCTACSRRDARSKPAREEWAGPMCCPHAALAHKLFNSPDVIQTTTASSMGMAAAVGGKVTPHEPQHGFPLLRHHIAHGPIEFFVRFPVDQFGRTKCIRRSNRRSCCTVMLYYISQVRWRLVELSELLIPMGQSTQFNFRLLKACPLWQSVCRQKRRIPQPMMQRNWSMRPSLL